MTSQQVNTVTLDRKEYDNMREDLRVFNAGAVVVSMPHPSMPGGYKRVALEVGDVGAFVSEEVSKELGAMRGASRGWHAVSENYVSEAGRLRAELEALREEVEKTPTRGVLLILAGVLLGATFTALGIWGVLA
jgi:hypothetical protein